MGLTPEIHDLVNSEKGMMSARNGDRARFQKNRKRKMRRRQRLQELVKMLSAQKALK